MKLPVDIARLVRGVSDDFDKTELPNAIRDLVNSEVNAWPKVITTTDATVTAAWSDDLPQNSVGDFTFTAIGLVTGAANTAGYRRRVVVARVGAAAVTYLGGGADVIGVDKETDPTWDAMFALDAAQPTKLFVCVQGAAATSITWRIHVKGTVLPWA